MGKLDLAPEIIDAARNLRLDPKAGAVSEIVGYCRDKLASFLDGAKDINTLDKVQAIVCAKLQLVFEEIWTDEDLQRISNKYVSKGEIIFNSLPGQFGDETFGTVIKRNHARADAPDLYVAVIDCRAEKAARRYFTRWHEIAHLLVPVEETDVSFDRPSDADANPIERLMDVIAGEIGFYEPIFKPLVEGELRASKLLTFEGIQRVRDCLCPEASFHAVLIACVKHNPIPTISLEACVTYKKTEAREIRSGQLTMFAGISPTPKLRAKTSNGNDAARHSGFKIHQYFAIPAASLVAKCFNIIEGDDSAHQGVSGEEEMSIWRDSNGKPAGHGLISVAAKKSGPSVLALLQRPTRPKMNGRIT